MSRTPAGYRHGLRVRMGGPSGPRGVLLECESRRTGGKYWRVRLQGGPPVVWCWPDERGGIVVDGDGEAVDVCHDCGLRFIKRAGSGELLCTRCDAEAFGTAIRAREVSDPPPTKRYGDTRPRRKWIPSKRGHS